MRGASIAIASAVLCAAGCNQILGIGGVTAGSGSADAPVTNPDVAMGDCPAPPADGIIGCANITHVHLDGSTTVTRKDLSGFNASAYVKNAAGNGFTIVNGTASADGTVVIHGIDPGASYYLRLQNPTDPVYPWPHYFYTSQRTLDLGYAEVGRDDTPATSQTDITFHLSALTGWAPNQNVYAESLNAGTSEGMTPTAAPAPGATAVDATSNWADGSGEASWADITSEAARRGQLLDAAHGDDLWIHHDQTRKIDVGALGTAPGVVQITTHTDSVMVSPGSMTNGTPATINATLAPTPQVATPQHVAMNYDAVRGAFRDNGNYTFETSNCTRAANPGADLGLQLDGLLAVNDPQVAGWEHTLDVTQPYGNPYPTTMPQVMVCIVGHNAEYKPQNKNIQGASYILGVVPATDNYTFAPPIHGATNVLIGGQPALPGGAVAFDGTTPVTMQWDPQASVTHYHVRVIGTVEGVVAEFDTGDTSILIPADTFTKGNFYILRVFAIQSSDRYDEGHLLRFTAPVWVVRLATGVFRFSDLCGNGTVDAGEACDPGAKNTSTTTCDADCTPVQCGDGFTNTVAGEHCDMRGDAAGCDGDCTAVGCGDGYWNPQAEECDDGNTVNGDGCNSACRLETCGNGTVEGNEACDDGNRKSGDGCSSVCQSECGDNFVDAPGEDCDPPNGTTCSDTCKKI